MIDFWNILKINFKNIPGKKVDSRFIVFESDDWGGIRMPSQDVYNQLIKADIPIGGKFDIYDTLADKQDLDDLFEVLLSVRDKNNHPAVFTPVTNVANPDFRRIKDSGFTQYFYEPFTDTLKRYGRHRETFMTWEKGREAGIFLPEFHGREHISVHFWLQTLQNGNKKVRTAFDHEFVNVHVNGVHPVVANFRPEFYFDDPDQIQFLKASISDGAKLFKDIFGYVPRAFTPSNSIFHPVFEKTVADAGISYLNVSHFNPVPGKNGRLKFKYYPVNGKSRDGLMYYSRNCAFEPITPSYKGVESTLRQIEAAFRWKKPAIISTHRANYIGSIDERNRRNGLLELKSLLNEIVKNWPDVEFLSTAQMLRILFSGNRSEH